ncbi:MAG: exonuclease SbcC [Firmicutes bacterium]|uniref:Exonuclease SbcC n=1 Tax=Candidatus Gallilactobacillus intestinavium TaxID=2840838 RepID=A0A9D9E8C2_9LACO|nr:exonuclease SbcC [Candidatus Gallilactobacillus intestinavium]
MEEEILQQQNNFDELAAKLTRKSQFLSKVSKALSEKNDYDLFTLVNPQAYHQLIKKERFQTNDFTNLIDDIYPEICHYLSQNLIKYLNEKYPFFIFQEIDLGKFKIHFGNWWDSRDFGELDVINVKFNFDPDEFDKLVKAFELEEQDKNLNSDKIKELSQRSNSLQELIENQEKRDLKKDELHKQLKEIEDNRSLFSSHSHEEKQALIDELTKIADEDDRANEAYSELEKLKQQSLELSKEDTVLSYEKNAIKKVFHDFKTFNDHNENLYVNYLNFLKH